MFLFFEATASPWGLHPWLTIFHPRDDGVCWKSGKQQTGQPKCWYAAIKHNDHPYRAEHPSEGCTVVWGWGSAISPYTTGIFPCYHAGTSCFLYYTSTLNSVRSDFCIHLPSTIYVCIYIMFFVIFYRWHLYPQCLKTCWLQQRRFLVTPGIVSWTNNFALCESDFLGGLTQFKWFQQCSVLSYFVIMWNLIVFMRF